jgi:hypothetical protein
MPYTTAVRLHRDSQMLSRKYHRIHVSPISPKRRPLRSPLHPCSSFALSRPRSSAISSTKPAQRAPTISPP